MNIESGVSHASEVQPQQEYQFGHETIVNITAQKIAEMDATSMPPKAQVEKVGELLGNWQATLDELEKSKGN